MVADSIKELHAFARKIGLRAEWFQRSNSGIPHYDLTGKTRADALKAGARQVGKKDIVRVGRGSR